MTVCIWKSPWNFIAHKTIQDTQKFKNSFRSSYSWIVGRMWQNNPNIWNIKERERWWWLNFRNKQFVKLNFLVSCLTDMQIKYSNTAIQHTFKQCHFNKVEWGNKGGRVHCVALHILSLSALVFSSDPKNVQVRFIVKSKLSLCECVHPEMEGCPITYEPDLE